jgi:hypothetical protein
MHEGFYEEIAMQWLSLHLQKWNQREALAGVGRIMVNPG